MRLLILMSILFFLSGCNATFKGLETAWPAFQEGWESGLEIDKQQIKELFGQGDKGDAG